MSDFKFTDEDSPPQPLPTPPPSAANEKEAELAAKPTEFSFTESPQPAPQKPIGPAPPTVSAPPIGPAPPIVTKPTVGPAPPVVPPVVSAAPVGPAPPKIPSPAPPSTPVVGNPIKGNPNIGKPVANAQSQAKGQGAAPSQTPAAGGARPNPANKPIPIPIPTPSIALPTEPEEPTGTNRAGAPQDDFSYKLWSIGQSIKSVLDAMEGPASWLLRVALVVGIASLAYVLAGTFFGKAGNLEGNANAAALVKNLTLATQGLMISLLAIGIAALLLGYEDNRLGFAVGGVGVLCHFVIPVLLKKMVGDSMATANMAPIFRHYGYFLVMIGLIKGLCDTAVWLWTLPDKIKEKHANVGVSNQAEAKQRVIARQANMTSPCWKLPFCRESIRKQCPAFLAKKTCWKFGRGCYCDEEMISRIVRGEALDVIKAPTRQSRQGAAPCGRCYIYLEHQTYKFRVMSPLALPASVLITWLIWPVYVKVFSVSNKAFDSIWNTLSFNSNRLRPDALATTADSLKEAANLGNRPEDIALIAQNMLGVLLGFMLLIYISKFIEWAIFKAKW